MLLSSICAFTHVPVSFMLFYEIGCAGVSKSSTFLVDRSLNHYEVTFFISSHFGLESSLFSSYIYLYFLQINSRIFLFFRAIEHSFWTVYLEFDLIHSNLDTILLSC